MNIYIFEGVGAEENTENVLKVFDSTEGSFLLVSSAFSLIQIKSRVSQDHNGLGCLGDMIDGCIITDACDPLLVDNADECIKWLFDEHPTFKSYLFDRYIKEPKNTNLTKWFGDYLREEECFDSQDIFLFTSEINPEEILQRLKTISSL